MGGRGIERGVGTVRGPQEAVIHAASVYIVSRDCCLRGDAGGESALGVGGSSSGNVQRDEGPVAGPQEAVTNGVCVIVPSRDCSRRVDGHGLDVYGARSGAREIERDVFRGFWRIILA